LTHIFITWTAKIPTIKTSHLNIDEIKIDYLKNILIILK